MTIEVEKNSEEKSVQNKLALSALLAGTPRADVKHDDNAPKLLWISSAGTVCFEDILEVMMYDLQNALNDTKLQNLSTQAINQAAQQGAIASKMAANKEAEATRFAAIEGFVSGGLSIGTAIGGALLNGASKSVEAEYNSTKNLSSEVKNFEQQEATEIANREISQAESQIQARNQLCPEGDVAAKQKFDSIMKDLKEESSFMKEKGIINHETPLDTELYKMPGGEKVTFKKMLKAMTEDERRSVERAIRKRESNMEKFWSNNLNHNSTKVQLINALSQGASQLVGSGMKELQADAQSERGVYGAAQSLAQAAQDIARSTGAAQEKAAQQSDDQAMQDLKTLESIIMANRAA